MIDVDSKIPNLALMKASTWHKQRGDSVKLGYEPLFDHPDLCYISKIFDFSPMPEFLPDCETIRGGPGFGDLSVRMPMDDGSGAYDRIMPDYELYYDRFPNIRYAIGRFTRGCPNRCPWCVVWRMDGNDVRHVADLTDFWTGQDTVRLLDDNIMADEEEFERDCAQIANAGVKPLWEALDIRLVTDRTATALASTRKNSIYHFAWDGPAEDRYIESGIQCLSEHGLKPWRLMFYVLVGFNTSREYDMHRIMALKALGANPFVMPYNKSDPYQHHLARWCNNKFVFKSCPTFDEYEPWQKYLRENGDNQ